MPDASQLKLIKPKYVICVDTNLYHTDYFLKNAPLNILFNRSVMLRAVAAVADVSLQELQSHFKLELEKANESTQSANRLLSKLSTIQKQQPKLDIDKEIDNYDSNIREGLKHRGITILPLPPVGYEELFDHMKRGKRPFTREAEKGDQGYKDFLLLRSFISSFVAKVPAIFVSADGDFYEGDEPHPDVVDLPPSNVSI